MGKILDEILATGGGGTIVDLNPTQSELRFVEDERVTVSEFLTAIGTPDNYIGGTLLPASPYTNLNRGHSAVKNPRFNGDTEWLRNSAWGELDHQATRHSW